MSLSQYLAVIQFLIDATSSQASLILYIKITYLLLLFLFADMQSALQHEQVFQTHQLKIDNSVRFDCIDLYLVPFGFNVSFSCVSLDHSNDKFSTLLLILLPLHGAE